MVFSGEYDIASKEQLRAACATLVAKPSVVLDFSDVTYIDSTAIGELIRLHKERIERDLEPATLVISNPNVRRVLELVSLGEVYRLVSSIDDAITKDGAPLAVRYVSAFD